MSTNDPTQPTDADPTKDPPPDRKPVGRPPGGKTVCPAEFKNLPQALQEEIYQRSNIKDAVPVVAWLQKEHRIKSSPDKLNHFFNWYPRSKYLKRLRMIVLQAMEDLLNISELKRNADEVVKVGQKFFELLALYDHDTRDIVLFAKRRNEEQKLTQNERRIFLQEKKAAQNEPPDPTTRLTAEEYDQKLKEILDLS